MDFGKPDGLTVMVPETAADELASFARQAPLGPMGEVEVARAVAAGSSHGRRRWKAALYLAVPAIPGGIALLAWVARLLR